MSEESPSSPVQNPDSTTPVEETSTPSEKTKIEILLKPAGNAPIMKTKKWAVGNEKTIGWVIDFIKRYLKLEANQTLFLYLNQSFAPAPDQLISNLYECFGADGNLVFHYSLTPAWG